MPLRVLIVAPALPLVGGQSVQAELIYRRFASDPALHMTFQPINPQLPSRLRWLQRIKYSRTLITFPLYCVQLCVAIARCDVVHIFSAAYLSFVLAPTPAITIARWFGKRVILNYHSGNAEDHLSRWPSAVRTLRRVNCIAVPSPFLVRVFRKFGLSAQCVPNAVDLSAFRFHARSQPQPWFLANRNFEAHYNLACVLRAFSLIQAQLPDARLSVAGDGPLKAELQLLAKTLALRNVEFIGRVAPADMPSAYDRHDFWLNASDVDNMPLSILEAFAAGTAVVSTNAGGIPDLVQDGQIGLLVPCGDAEALAQTAIDLVAQPARFAALTSAAQAECEKYTWDAVKAGWLRLYLEPTSPRAPTSPRLLE